MGLNYTDALILTIFFSSKYYSTTGFIVVESMNGELWIWRNHLYGEPPIGYTCPLHRRLVSLYAVSFRDQFCLSFKLYLVLDIAKFLLCEDDAQGIHCWKVESVH